MHTVRLLTFNTLYRGRTRARLRGLGRALEGSAYDVVCLQELMSAPNLALLRRGAPSYRAGAHAPLYPMVRGGLATLSRLPLAQRGFSHYRPGRPLRREWAMFKGMLTTGHVVDGMDLVVLNTHLSANTLDDWMTDNRCTRLAAAELRQLAGVVRSIGADRPLVVTGDFNVPRDSTLLGEFLAATGLRDVLADDCEPTYRPTTRWPNPPALDQILVRTPSTLTMTARARTVLRDEVRLDDGSSAFLSDHYGVEAELTFAPASV